jgi:hypothetical protein
MKTSKSESEKNSVTRSRVIVKKEALLTST